MELSGCGTALITPFRPDGSLDEAALRAHVQHQIANGITLLVPCGTTGEAATLTDAETLRVIELTCEAAQGRAHIFAGCTHNSTAAAVARARQFAQIPGLTGLLSANPYYNRPGQEGQYQHFRAIADATALPLMLYNIPSRTAANLEPATVLRLAQIDNIVAIKESSGNLVQIGELLTQVPPTFHVFSGDDALTLPILALGGVGLISVASNVIPAEMVSMVRAALANDWTEARRINRRFYTLMQAHFWEPSPAPVKAVLALLGRGEETLRSPILPVTEATRQRLRELVEALKADLQIV